jgi:hypothetical protein
MTAIGERREISAIDVSLFETPEGECSIVLQGVPGKAISSSFAGACASSLRHVQNLLRTLHRRRLGFREV